MSVNQNTLKHIQEPIYSQISPFDFNSLVVAVCVSICQPCTELVPLASRLLGKAPAPWNPAKGCDDGWMDLWVILICYDSSGKEHELAIECNRIAILLFIPDMRNSRYLEVYFSHADLVHLFPELCYPICQR